MKKNYLELKVKNLNQSYNKRYSMMTSDIQEDRISPK